MTFAAAKHLLPSNRERVKTTTRTENVDGAHHQSARLKPRAIHTMIAAKPNGCDHIKSPVFPFEGVREAAGGQLKKEDLR